MKESVEIGNRKHFKHNHWSVTKQSQKEPTCSENSGSLCEFLLLGFGGVEKVKPDQVDSS